MSATMTDAEGRLRVAHGTGGGEFTNHDRSTDDITLGQWPAAPTSEQTARAAAEVQRRMTAYPGAITDPDTVTSRLAARLAEQEACYHAFTAGYAHPDDTAYEGIWNRHDSRGVDRWRAAEALRYWETLHAGLLDGTTHPRLLQGRDATESDRPAAIRTAEEGIALYREAFTCAGRNLSINQIAVTQKRVDEIEAATPF